MRRIACAANTGSIRVLGVAGVSSVLEYTTLSAACQMRAKPYATCG
jgi:hypothetical protein